MRIIQTANPGAVADVAMSHLPDPSAMGYFQQQYQNFVNTVQEYAGGFINRVQQMYETFSSNEIIQKAKEFITRSKGIVYDDRIYPVDANSIHNAGWVMREFILANPQMYTMYQNNRLCGWEDQVFLPEENLDPRWRDDYLNAVDGVLQFDENGEGYFQWYSGEDDNPFTISERVVINNAWDIAMEAIAAGIDPTDPEKNKI